MLLLFCIPVLGQNVIVDKDTYSPQELIEDVLINSGCIEDIEVTNVVGANFANGDQSYGYFENDGGPFPFEKGIVMTTGRLANVPGPNDGLSDDDAAGWVGDDDLEDYLDLNHTVNATVLEFDFTPVADNIRFRYIFASEEYREFQSTTCEYSDAFAFLIRPVGTDEYDNLAVIPGTDIPVKVTTVHSGIPGSCPPQNEEYFAGFNPYDSPIIFNGQTKILTAESQVVPGTTYHIKLVIADDINYRYDSAVFLEGESFNIGANLGEDITGLCEGETHLLEPLGIGNDPTGYQWYKVEGNEEVLLAEGQDSYEVSESGTYKVVIEYGGSCTAEDEIEVSYVNFEDLDTLSISSCIQSDENENGFLYDLPSFENIILQGEDYIITDYYLSEEDADSETNPIENPAVFHSSEIGQEIFVSIESERGCTTVLKITLSATGEDLGPVYLYTCPDEYNSINYTFNLTDAIADVQEELGIYIDFFEFYQTESDAFFEENPLDNSYSISTSDFPNSVFIRVDGSLGCQGLIEIKLEDLDAPEIDPNFSQEVFCEGANESITLYSGVIDNEEDLVFEWENGATTPSIDVTDPGAYQVTISKPHLVSGDTIYCTKTHTVQAETSEKPTVDYQFIGEPGDYTVEVIVSGIGDYEFALDDSPWQLNNIFKVDAGKHDIY
ncbi:MAG TPA: choice-of-anchor L domain-containing protein, partial [Flavobacteriaceae bacterium]|nr:choice-of-anchor L domain-containing protein [Flavobacteriaceae bacterium]